MKEKYMLILPNQRDHNFDHLLFMLVGLTDLTNNDCPSLLL